MPKFKKDLFWLEPFVHTVRHKVPVDRILSISGYRVPFNKKEDAVGSCIGYRKKYRILLLTQRHDRKENRYRPDTYKPEIIENLLITLAHELAHTVHWEHTKDFAKLYAEILYAFFTTAHVLGIPDIQKRYNTVKRVK